MSESRPPEEMPTEWTVASFSHEQGFGTLAHASGEQVQFGIEAWQLGFEPTEKEKYMSGPGSPLLPHVGEPVTVEWKQSRLGKNVPKLVQPTGRARAVRKTHTLGDWMKAMRQHAHLFAGVTPAALLKVMAAVDEDAAEEWRGGDAREATEFTFLLRLLSSADDDWTSLHTSWLYVEDHRWDRDRTARSFHAMLNLPRGTVPPAGDGRMTGTDESLADYAGRCNAAAETQGRAVRLCDLTVDDDGIFVALTPTAFAALTEGEYLHDPKA